jgi:hypothetical protein
VERAPVETQGRTTAERGLALVLVGPVDRRMVPALTLTSWLPELDAKALHIAVDPEESMEVAAAWMELDLWVPLQIEEPREGEPFLECVQRLVGAEAAHRRRVVVLVPELDLGRWWPTLLHRGTGRRIARLLQSQRGVSTVVLPCPR